MLPELAPTAQAFVVGDLFLRRLVGDFTPEDWQVRDAVGHDPRWLVGHLAATRQGVLKILELEPQEQAWEAFFRRGTSPADLPPALDLAPILEAFHGAQAQMAGAWAGLSPEALAKPFVRTLPDGSKTVGDALRFLAWHEAYHLGQLAILRRLAGKSGLA
jgi:uncharacterized damage-inducible protein DinB